MADKHTLREVYLSKRLMLDPIEHKKRCEYITRRAIALIDERQAKNIHVFLPIQKKKEVDTWGIINHFAADNSINFIVPKIISNHQLEHYELNKNCKIALNKWGIPEPVSGDLADVSSIDLVFVPLIIADKLGNRIGYGKGFYDRFLSKISAYKVGLSIQPLLDEISYLEETDAVLDDVLCN